MHNAQTHFKALLQEYGQRDSQVSAGKMMSSPAITYKGKVFIFLSRKGELVFKLGKKFEPQSMQCEDLTEFNPFKTKGPLRGWFVCSNTCGHLWEALAEQAYAKIQE